MTTATEASKDRALAATADSLMRAVVGTGIIRDDPKFHDGDVTLAVKVMREELKLFLGITDDTAGKYIDERALTLEGKHNLATSSLVAECVSRIIMERAK